LINFIIPDVKGGTILNHWDILNIPPTDNKEAIKSAYMAQLPKYNPEDDPDGFVQLRIAYEEALGEADSTQEEDLTPTGLFVKRVSEVYSDFSQRCDIEIWKELLKDEVCVRIDLMEETQLKLLAFLMGNHFLPKDIWMLLSNHFDWSSEAAGLRTYFPELFIIFIMNRSSPNSSEGLKYSLFKPGYETQDYDNYINSYHELESVINSFNIEQTEEIMNEMDDLLVSHPYLDLQRARLHLYKNEYNDALDISALVFEKLPNDVFAHHIYALSLLYTGNPSESLKHFLEISEKHPNSDSKKGLVDCYIALKEFSKARDILSEVLNENPYDAYAGPAYHYVTAQLSLSLKAKYEEGDKSVASQLIEYCLDTFQFDKCLEICLDILSNEEEKNNQRYLIILAECYSSVDPEKAIELYESSAIILEDELQPYVPYVNALLAAERQEEALTIAEKALAKEVKEVNTDNMVKNARLKLIECKATCYFQLEHFDKALDSLDEGLKISPNDAQLYRHKARIYQLRGRYGDAIEHCEKSLSIYPFHTEPYVIKMEIYEEVDHPEKMLEVAESAELAGYESPRILYYKAVALRMSAKLDEAQKIIDELLEAEFDEGSKDYFYTEAAYLCEINEDWELANEYMTKAMELNPYVLDRYFHFGYQFLQLHKYDEAEEAYKRAIELFPKHSSTYSFYALFLRNRSRFEEAIEMFNIAMEKDSGHTTFHDEIAYCLGELKRYQEALTILNKGISLSVPNIGSLYFRRGKIYEKMDYFNEAIEDFEKALEIDGHSTFPTIYSDIGLIYDYNLNNAQRAMDYYLKAILHDDNLAEVYKHIADLFLYFKKDYKAAINYLDLKIESEPDDPHAYVSRARAYVAMNEDMLARRDFEYALELYEKKSEEDSSSCYEVYKASCKLGLGHYDEAKEIYEAMIDTPTNDPEAWCDKPRCDVCLYGLGAICEKEGRVSEAAQYYKEAISIANSVRHNAALDALDALK